jgi:protein subunit release factor B
MKNKEWFEYHRQQEKIILRLIGREYIITPKDVDISFFSGGPGGQNLNRHMNGVRIIYHIPDELLHPYQKTTQLVARSMNQRNQARNRQAAFDELAGKIKRYFYMPPKRKKTRIPKKSKEKRLNEKKKRSELKKDRGKVDY